MATQSKIGMDGASGCDCVVIKKYANRRLYDTNESRYVNLERIAEILRDGEDVKVIEAKGGADVTHQVLTQIIVEGAKVSGEPSDGPPTEFLKDLVRAGDRAQRDFLHWYLSSAAQVYQRMRGGWEKAYRLSPAGRLSEQLRKTWDPASVVPAMMRGLVPFLEASTPESTAQPARKSAAKDHGPDTATQLAELRRQLEALEEKLES